MSKPKDFSALSLRLLAMTAMVCDHLWATLIPGNAWLTWAGRLAFPIFSFLLVEGYFHTRDFKKYLKRIVLFAILSELPFNLMYTGSWIFPFHQNVLWTFTLGLLCMNSLDQFKARLKPWLSWPLMLVTASGFALLAQLTMVDYYGYGLLTILVFYFFRENKLGQLLGLYCINWHLMGGMTVPLLSWEIPQQSFALLALIPIWFYQGRQGPKNQFAKWLFYGFYPLHMLVLGLLSM